MRLAMIARLTRPLGSILTFLRRGPDLHASSLHFSYRAINRARARSLRTLAGALNLRGGSRAHFYLKAGAARNNREFRKGHAQVAYISDYRSVSLLLSHEKFAPANCNEQRALSARSLAPGCRLMSTRDKESIVHQS